MITQNILQTDIDNHSLNLLKTIENYTRELGKNPYQNFRATPRIR